MRTDSDTQTHTHSHTHTHTHTNAYINLTHYLIRKHEYNKNYDHEYY
jgi:hypothetical protein